MAKKPARRAAPKARVASAVGASSAVGKKAEGPSLSALMEKAMADAIAKNPQVTDPAKQRELMRKAREDVLAANR